MITSTEVSAFKAAIQDDRLLEVALLGLVEVIARTMISGRAPADAIVSLDSSAPATRPRAKAMTDDKTLLEQSRIERQQLLADMARRREQLDREETLATARAAIAPVTKGAAPAHDTAGADRPSRRPT